MILSAIQKIEVTELIEKFIESEKGQKMILDTIIDSYRNDGPIRGIFRKLEVNGARLQGF